MSSDSRSPSTHSQSSGGRKRKYNNSRSQDPEERPSVVQAFGTLVAYNARKNRDAARRRQQQAPPPQLEHPPRGRNEQKRARKADPAPPVPEKPAKLRPVADDQDLLEATYSEEETTTIPETLAQKKLRLLRELEALELAEAEAASKELDPDGDLNLINRQAQLDPKNLYCLDPDALNYATVILNSNFVKKRVYCKKAIQKTRSRATLNYLLDSERVLQARETFGDPPRFELTPAPVTPVRTPPTLQCPPAPRPARSSRARSDSPPVASSEPSAPLADPSTVNRPSPLLESPAVNRPIPGAFTFLEHDEDDLADLDADETADLQQLIKALPLLPFHPTCFCLFSLNRLRRLSALDPVQQSRLPIGSAASIPLPPSPVLEASVQQSRLPTGSASNNDHDITMVDADAFTAVQAAAVRKMFEDLQREKTVSLDTFTKDCLRPEVVGVFWPDYVSTDQYLLLPPSQRSDSIITTQQGLIIIVDVSTFEPRIDRIISLCKDDARCAAQLIENYLRGAAITWFQYQLDDAQRTAMREGAENCKVWRAALKERFGVSAAAAQTAMASCVFGLPQLQAGESIVQYFSERLRLSKQMGVTANHDLLMSVWHGIVGPLRASVAAPTKDETNNAFIDRLQQLEQSWKQSYPPVGFTLHSLINHHGTPTGNLHAIPPHVSSHHGVWPTHHFTASNSNPWAVSNMDVMGQAMGMDPTVHQRDMAMDHMAMAHLAEEPEHYFQYDNSEYGSFTQPYDFVDDGYSGYWQ
ncbi:hypothetical protein BJ508DRAFT_334072 [Ascobolus immersus RN42]|uniref:Uncharacterized protein n=1 Tax=Ascobolus immersus RN42 TaxID=1160509 RepID=A0A3N4HLN2_ASCIM|nr:hypothetical protein BJ508DRAFT_334072 [Ascobolus immersus RN42]